MPLFHDQTPHLPLSFPLYVGVFMGHPSHGQTVIANEFDTQEHFDIAVRAMNTASGWQDFTEVPHANHVVNAQGEIVERKAPAKAPIKPTCYIVWGESPEQGSRPERFTFKTEAEKELFLGYAGQFIGNENYYWVPSGDFVAVIPEKDNLDNVRPYLSSEHVEDFLEYARASLLNEERFFFVRRDGAFVDEYWLPGHPVNGYLSREEWRDRFEAKAQEVFGAEAVKNGDPIAWNSSIYGDNPNTPEDAALAWGTSLKQDVVPQRVKRPR